MPTQRAVSDPRTRDRQARSLTELGVVLLLTVAFYGVAARWDLAEWVDRTADAHRRRQVDEMFLALPVALLLLAVYAWRRYREAQAETAVAVTAERALARSAEEFRSLFEYHPHAVFSVDLQRRYRRANPAAEALGGYTEEELRSLIFPSLKSQDRERVIDAFERAVGREPQRLQARLLRRDGQQRDVEVTMVPIVVGDDPVGVYVIAGDITEDNRLRQELAQALAEAERANDAKTLLVANVSHELRTPLTSVIAAAELLADEPLAKPHHRLVDTIGRNGQALLRLVDDLLDVTRMAVGQLTTDVVPFELRDVLDRAVAHVSTQASRVGLALRIELDEPMPPTLLGDPLRVGQVLANLLSNAVKFTDHGEIGLALDWQQRDHGPVETVLRVWDTGIGIAPDDQERLFGHFMQADPSSTRRHGGTGLGLAISRQLVELMGGTLCLESQPGAGSTFTVRLPFQLAADH